MTPNDTPLQAAQETCEEARLQHERQLLESLPDEPELTDREQRIVDRMHVELDESFRHLLQRELQIRADAQQEPPQAPQESPRPRRHAGRILRRVLVAVLILNFLLTVAIAAVEPLRTHVVGMLVQVSHGRASIDVADPDLIPADWSADYFPAYIPRGFALVSSGCTPQSSSASFASTGGDWLQLYVSDAPDTIYTNAYEAQVSSTKIGSSQAVIYEQPDCTSVAWMVGRTRFLVITSLDTEEAIDIANSFGTIY